jgi:hypothetical protein
MWRFDPNSSYASPSHVSFLQFGLFCAADFEGGIWSKETASFCTLSSQVLRGLSTELFLPEHSLKIYFEMG